MNEGFGSRILCRLIEKYLHIGYINVHTTSTYVKVIFYRGITRYDLSETHCIKFMSFLRNAGITQFYSEKKSVSGNPHDANTYWVCTVNIKVENLAGLIRIMNGGK